MTGEIEPIAIPPDEAEREMLRGLIFEAEAAGRPERVYPAVRDALYDSWALADALLAEIADLRAARGAPGPGEEE